MATTLQVTRTTTKSPESLWEVLADFPNIATWYSGLKTSVSTSAHPDGVGATRHCELAPVRAIDERILDWEEGSRVRIAAEKYEKAPIKEAVADFRITPEGDHTRLDLRFEFTPKNTGPKEGCDYGPDGYKPGGTNVGVNTTKAEPIEKIEIKLTVSNEGTRLNAKGNGPWEGEGRYSFGDDRVISYAVGPRRFSTVREVKERLDVLYDPTDPRPVTIDPRKGVVYADVVEVLDAAIQAKFREITFAGSYEK